MTGSVFSHKFGIHKGNASGPEDALADGKYPASASFIDVSKAERVHIVLTLGALADALTFTVQAANAANGTPANVDATNLQRVLTATDDDEVVVFSFETSELPTGDHFVTLDVSGVVGTNHACINYFLEGVEQPASHGATVNENYAPQ